MSRHKKGSLIFGVTLIVIGVLCVAIPSGQMFVELFVRFWPVLLISFGLLRVATFLRSGRPRSPVGGALLVGIGGLFLINNFTSNSAFQAYGRFWPFLLLAFGLGELIFQYSRRGMRATAPPVLTIGKLLVVVSLVATGVVSARIAKTNPNFFSASMPEAFSQFRDAIFGREYTFEAPVQTFPFSTNSKIVINNSYGNVDVKTSSDNQMSITLTKVIREYNGNSAADINSKVKLLVSKTDGGYMVTTNRDEIRSSMKTNLVIRLPKNAMLQIDNRSGRISIGGFVGDQNIANSRGAIDITDIQGRVKVENQFSHTTIQRVSGATVESKHGSVDLKDVTGDIDISSTFDRITAENISGAAKISNEHGNIKLTNITGIVTAEADKTDISGDNLHSDAKLSSSHCKISLNKIEGDALIAAPFANIDATDITGSLTIQEDAHGSVRARRINGSLNVSGADTDVVASNIGGPSVIETTHAKVQVSDFSSSLICKTSDERVTLSPSTIKGNVEVENSRGEIRLNVPTSIGFQLDANARQGRVVSQGFDLQLTSDKENASANVGPGGPAVKLSTSYANIVVKSISASELIANTNE